MGQTGVSPYVRISWIKNGGMSYDSSQMYRIVVQNQVERDEILRFAQWISIQQEDQDHICMLHSLHSLFLVPP